MNQNLSIDPESMPSPNPYVIPLPPDDPGHASPVEIVDPRIRNRTQEIHRLLQILRESSFTYREWSSHPIHGSIDCMKELDKIYQYASALLLCNEIPKLASTRRYHNHFEISQQFDEDHKAIKYAWNSWWILILRESKSTTDWGISLSAFSHPIGNLFYLGNLGSNGRKYLRARPHLFFPLYGDREYASKSANFMRTSIQERKYILNFFRDIGKVKKKIMICRFDIFMDRHNYDPFSTIPWHLRLRENVRQMMERVKHDFKHTLGYLHFIPSSNTIAPPESPSLSHLIMAFDLPKDDHHLLSQTIASSRVIQGDDNFVEFRPTCGEQKSCKAIGCGVLDLSRVSSLPIIDGIADYMTVERRVLRPLMLKPNGAGWQVIKGLQIHSFV